MYIVCISSIRQFYPHIKWNSLIENWKVALSWAKSLVFSNMLMKSIIQCTVHFCTSHNAWEYNTTLYFWHCNTGQHKPYQSFISRYHKQCVRSMPMLILSHLPLAELEHRVGLCCDWHWWCQSYKLRLQTVSCCSPETENYQPFPHSTSFLSVFLPPPLIPSLFTQPPFPSCFLSLIPFSHPPLSPTRTTFISWEGKPQLAKRYLNSVLCGSLSIQM